MMWREVRKTCRWKHPRALSVRLLFQASPVVLIFLRKAKAGEVVSLARLEEEVVVVELLTREEVKLMNRGGGGSGPP